MAKQVAKQALVKDGKDILGRRIMVTPVDSLSTDEVHYAWSVLDLFGKALKARQSEFRDRLLAEAEEHGELTPKGHYVLELADGKVTRQRRQGSDQVDAQAVMDLLRGKGIDIEEAFNRRTVYELDEAKLATLIAAGQITEDEAAQVIVPGKVTWALKVEKPSDLPKSILPSEGNGKSNGRARALKRSSRQKR